MRNFSIVPKIQQFENCKELCEVLQLGAGDLIFVSERTYQEYFKEHVTEGAHIVNYRKYGQGEPNDAMVEGIFNDIKEIDYQRVVAIGGGTILDVAKLFALKTISPVVDLFQKKLEIVKDKELVLVPTTCGTGSEVTNISILELTSIQSKFGLAVDELYADIAVLVPELLENLPMKYFATSSIDALIHAVESYTSPKANDFTQMFSKKAIEIILKGYMRIIKEGEAARKKLSNDFLLASTYGGIAFGNAGCGAVHAMSYPLGANYHVAHGEANYAFFTGVYKTYQKMNPDGSIKDLNEFLAGILKCDAKDVYLKIELLLDQILMKKALHEYGVKEEELEVFADSVVTQQQRLLANNYVPLSKEKILQIYKKLY